MAIITKIRERSGLLITLIALALAGFILMDMMSNRSSGGFFSGSDTQMGKVAGKTIDYHEFSRVEKILYAGNNTDPFGQRTQLWNFFVEEALVSKEAEALGLGVGKEELMDLQFGTNLSPVIMQRFQNPNTGQVDIERLARIKQAIEANQLTAEDRAFWAQQEKEIIKDRLQAKFTNMASKAIYTPSWMVDQTYADQNQRIDFTYVKVPLDQVNDSEIKLTDADYAAFLNENKGVYTVTKEARKVSFVAFNVVPTSADSAKIREELDKLVPEFKTTTKDSLFVVTNDGNYDDGYVKKEALSPAIADSAMKVAIGTVVGPYVDGNQFAIMKVLGRMTIADSVRARHILIQAKSPQDLAIAEKRIDSLKTVIEKGAARFDTLASIFGQDATNAKGGDLGYAAPGQMVKAFNDLIFFKAEKGKLYTVQTQFGVHLVEVTDKKFIKNDQGVKVAYIRQPIVPSEETQAKVEDQARQFLQANRTIDNMKQAAEKAGLRMETSGGLGENDYTVGVLGGNQTSRDMVKWAYNPKTRVGDVSPDLYIFEEPALYYNNKYVVAALKGILKPGAPTVEAFREEIEPAVKNRKKAEILKSKINTTDLATVASTYSTRIDTAKGVTFVSPFIAGLGNEPKVVAKAFGIEPGNAAGPIAGNNGVYVLQVVNKPGLEAAGNVPVLRQQFSMNMRNQIKSRLLQSIIEKANIRDTRSKFF